MGLIGEIISDFAQPMTRLRPQGMTVRNGDYFSGPVVEIPLVATAQPAPGDVAEQFPEAERSRDAIWIYSQEPLQIAARNTPADIVLFNGKYYKVVKSQDWRLGGFYKALGIALNQQPTIRPVYAGSALSFTNSEVGYKRELKKFIQHNREMVFDVNVLASERIFIVLPSHYGMPRVLVDELETTFEVTETLGMDGVISQAFRSPPVELGPHRVVVR